MATCVVLSASKDPFKDHSSSQSNPSGVEEHLSSRISLANPDPPEVLPPTAKVELSLEAKSVNLAEGSLVTEIF